MPPSPSRRAPRASAPIVLAACAILATSPSRAAPAPLPPIAAPATQEHHTGKTVFVQLITPDLAASEAFYTGLLGWQFQPIPNTRVPYAAAISEGHLVGGVAQRAIPAGQHLQSAWLGFFSVPDVNAAVTLAAAQGAKTLAAPHDVPGLGREAVLADPQGAVFGILASSSGDPPDILSPVGTWIWRSLLTTDPTADAAFYNTVLGFNATPFPSEGAAEHLLLVSGTYARATANSFPGNHPGMRPHWLNYVRVANAAQAAATATSLGGRILVPPHPDRHGGMIAVVADPEGAPLGLFEWAEGVETKDVTK